MFAGLSLRPERCYHWIVNDFTAVIGIVAGAAGMVSDESQVWGREK